MSASITRVRVILQQCLSAKLQIQPATEGKQAEFVTVGRGLVVYVCFMSGAEQEKDLIDKLVKTVLNVRLSESLEDGTTVSILDLPGDVLIVPQATLGGRLKGKMMQYHGNIDKKLGSDIYNDFIRKCREVVQAGGKSAEAGSRVEAGTYGNRQVLSIETNGPYSHLVEL